MINQREGWRGHLWQERFSSFVMDEMHLMAAVRYVELNPVRAGLVDLPEDYRWSSARAHLRRKNDELVTVDPLLEIVDSWEDYLQDDGVAKYERLRKHEKTGRPLGADKFIEMIEKKTGRTLKPLRRR
jgi:putative transposase